MAAPVVTKVGAQARDRAVGAIDTFGEMLVLGGRSVGLGTLDVVTGRFPWREYLEQAWFMVRVAFWPTVLVAVPFGVIVSVQVGAVAEQIGAVAFTGAVNGIGILRQGAPLVTSLLMAGAVGSALCAQIGSQTVREEIDAMRVMGLDPVRRLVAPRVAAAVTVGLLLNVVVATTAILTGYALNVGTGAVSSGAYLGSFVSFAQPTDLLLAQGKAAVFGLIATVIACHQGLAARGGPKGVADAVNASVVLGVIALAVVNVAITQAYVMLVPARLA